MTMNNSTELIINNQKKLIYSALEEEFSDWWANNYYLLEVGLCGDLLDLRLRLNAAFTKASNSSPVTSNEL